MGANDAAEMLEVAKAENVKLELALNAAKRVVDRIEMYVEDNTDGPVFLDHIDRLIAEYREEVSE